VKPGPIHLHIERLVWHGIEPTRTAEIVKAIRRHIAAGDLQRAVRKSQADRIGVAVARAVTEAQK
jgi:hypothetical protein